MADGPVDQPDGEWRRGTLGEALAVPDLPRSVQLVLERAGGPWLAEETDPKPALGLGHPIRAAVSVGRTSEERRPALRALAEAVDAANMQPVDDPPAVARDGMDLAAIPLSPAAQAAPNAARAVRDRTAPVQTISDLSAHRIRARHLVAVLIAPFAEDRLRGPLERVRRRTFGVALEELRSRIAAAFDGVREMEPERSAWDEIFGAVRLATAAFHADQPGGGDALGRRGDARRLAAAKQDWEAIRTARGAFSRRAAQGSRQPARTGRRGCRRRPGGGETGGGGGTDPRGGPRNLRPFPPLPARPIKRFVNRCRFARSARGGPTPQRRLAETSNTPRFPAFALALAVENGFDNTSRHAWYKALVGRSAEDVVADAIDHIDDGATHEARRTLRATLRAARAFRSDDSLGGALTVGEIAAHLDEARHLSFHPAEFDPTPLPEETRPDSPGA